MAPLDEYRASRKGRADDDDDDVADPVVTPATPTNGTPGPIEA